jgi:autotransporter adhesin
VTFRDDAGTPVQIHGVAEGTADTDAVNVSQLEDLEDEAFRGIAISMALDSFLPDSGKKFRLNFGSAVYKGEAALGITGAGRITENVILYIGVGSDMGFHEAGGKAGISLQW